MKKQFLAVAIAAFAIVGVKAQEGLKVSANIGVPVGNASDYFGVNVSGDVAYLYPVIENLSVGGKAGLEFFSGKDISNTSTKTKGATFLPIAATAQYNITDDIFAGLDLGAAFSLSDAYKGGLYYLPKVGWQNDTFQAFFFVKGISSDLKKLAPLNTDFSSITTVGVGGAYKF